MMHIFYRVDSEGRRVFHNCTLSQAIKKLEKEFGPYIFWSICNNHGTIKFQSAEMEWRMR